MAAASPLLLRSRVSARAISLTLRPCNKSGQPGASTSVLCSLSRRSSAKRRPSLVSRLLSVPCFPESMLPLHSAVASARLNSALAAESQRWGCVPQGISLPL